MRTATIILLSTALSSNLVWGQEKDVDSERFIHPVERSATFPGGMDSLKSFINKNLARPIDDSVKGMVYIQFIIDRDGTTSDFEVLRGLTKECDERALEVLRKMPKWVPGTMNDIPIRQRCVMPVRF